MNSQQTTVERRASLHNSEVSKANTLTTSLSRTEIGWDSYDDDIRLFVCCRCRTLPPCQVPPSWAGMSHEQQTEVIMWLAVMAKVGVGLLAEMGITL